MRLSFAPILLLCAAAVVGFGACSKPNETAPKGSSGAADANAAGTSPSDQGSRPDQGSPAAGTPVSGHDSCCAPSAATAAALPPGHPPIEEPPSGEPLPGTAGSAPPMGGQPSGGQMSGGHPGAPLSWTVPQGWKEETPKSPMRKAQFRIPGRAGSKEDAECVVFYFGPGQGGSAESNATRWVDQFQQPDGSSSQGQSKVAVRSVNGNQVMFVEVKGTYSPVAMPGAPSAEPRPGYAMIGAIVSSADAPWFFKMTGPAKTIDANREAFESLIASIKPGT